jgi:hypothetical protein
VAEFLSFVRHGGATNTSPLAARFAVAAGCAAADSLRSGGTPQDVADVAPQCWSYFNEQFQTPHVEPFVKGHAACSVEL